MRQPDLRSAPGVGSGAGLTFCAIAKALMMSLEFASAQIFNLQPACRDKNFLVWVKHWWCRLAGRDDDDSGRLRAESVTLYPQSEFLGHVILAATIAAANIILMRP